MGLALDLLPQPSSGNGSESGKYGAGLLLAAGPHPVFPH